MIAPDAQIDLPPDDTLEAVLALATASLFGEATPEEITRLEQLVVSDDSACRVYVDAMLDSQSLHNWSSHDAPEESAVPAAPVLGFLGSCLDSAWQGTSGYFADHPGVFSYVVATVLFAVAALVASQIYLPRHQGTDAKYVKSHSISPAPVPVKHDPGSELVSIARITGMADCRWVNESDAPFHDRVVRGAKFILKSGLMEITYHTGARVILQGPCTYEVESADGGYLSLGKLTARVEKKSGRVGEGERGRGEGKQQASPRPRAPTEGWSGRGAGGEGSEESPEHSALTLTLSQRARGPNSPSLTLPPSPLFAIRTPTATVTDLGTEFGVNVDGAGTTESLVFVGKVMVKTHIGKGKTREVVLSANQSARAVKQPNGNAATLVVGHGDVKPKDFVRVMKNPVLVKPDQKLSLDLADIVCGGNGTHNRRGHGINPVNATSEDAIQFQGVVSDGKYHPIAWHPLLDGVFIPAGGHGPVQLDTAGHAFDGFPKTSGRAFATIWSGLPDDLVKLMSRSAAIAPAKELPPALYLHANAGITFRLDAISKFHPGWKLSRFRAKAFNCGIEPVGDKRVSADIWVFVDGQPCFSKTDVNAHDGKFDIGIPLVAANRFLSLVATDAGNDILSDGVVFEEPRVVLAPGDNPNAP